MKRNRVPHARLVMLAPALALIAASACNSGSSMKKAGAEKNTPAAAQNAQGPTIELNCIVTRLQNPPEAFHYSYKNNGQTHSVDEEADVTPQMIDGFIQNSNVGAGSAPITSKIHALRSDSSGWDVATGSVGMGVSGMAMGVALMYHSPADAMSEGTESVNGYSATKYSFDTSRGSAAENAIVLGQGGFLKGTIWALPDGCPVKMVLDQENHHGNEVDKDHYEEAIVKK